MKMQTRLDKTANLVIGAFSLTFFNKSYLLNNFGKKKISSRHHLRLTSDPSPILLPDFIFITLPMRWDVPQRGRRPHGGNSKPIFYYE